MRPSSAVLPGPSVRPLALVHSSLTSLASILPCLTHLSTREPLVIVDRQAHAWESLDPFPSGPPSRGRARQTRLPSPPAAMTRCFPACLAEKPALPALLSPARISSAKGLATLSKEEGQWTTQPSRWEVQAGSKDHCTDVVWLGLAWVVLFCRSL